MMSLTKGETKVAKQGRRGRKLFNWKVMFNNTCAKKITVGNPVDKTFKQINWNSKAKFKNSQSTGTPGGKKRTRRNK